MPANRNLREAYTELLRAHDWHHERSDDQGNH